MLESRIATLDNFWSNQEDTVLQKPFVFADGFFEGAIKLEASPKAPLEFTVRLPLSYPLTNDRISIRFVCTSHRGIRHLNADNSVCMLVPPNADFGQRLHDELCFLRLWRDRYYLSDEKDERYDYPIAEYQDNNTFLFTDSDGIFRRGDFGSFRAIQYQDHTQRGLADAKSYFILSIGNAKCRWGERMHELKANTEGLYYFLEQEPSLEAGKLVTDWKDLDPLVDQKFKGHLAQLKTASKIPEVFFVFFGYIIPSTNEIHWEIAAVEAASIPVKSRKVTARYYEYDLIPQEIGWSKTVNISYDRFFGRGGLDVPFANKKILILGWRRCC